MKKQTDTFKRLRAVIKDINGDNRQIIKTMQDQIEYLMEFIDIQGEILEEKTGNCQPELTIEQKKRLAHRGKKLNAFLLGQIENTFAPSTVLKWYSELISNKYNSVGANQKKRGRKPVNEEIVAAGYQKLLDKNRIAYSWWHEEQAKAIKETYAALSELYLSIDSKLCCMNKNNSCSNCDPALQNSYKNAKNIWSRNKIFFEEDFNKRITDIFTISFDIKTSVSQFNGCVHKRQSVIEYCQQNKEKIDSILLELRQQLRIVMSGRITEK